MYTLLRDHDLQLFREGAHHHLYKCFGAHPATVGREGVYFSLWAPNAEKVSVIGGFNDWSPNTNPLERRGDSGVWEGFLPGARKHALYKYHIVSRNGQFRVDKADPFALFAEHPGTASIVWDLQYAWEDEQWMANRRTWNALDRPISIYEVHAGSWMRAAEDGNRPLSYRELAPRLAEYVKQMGFTHVEFLPLTEHPFYGSWGYQVTGYFAPTSRYGTPQDFMWLIDCLHRNGIGVFLDWVPSHFATDEHGLGLFDGTHLYEPDNPMMTMQPEWNSYAFDYGREEVRSFLLSSAEFWLDKYHVDGLRVDGVASMLYRDYARKPGEWAPNALDGRENLEGVEFLRNLNQSVYGSHPDVQTIAEESTAWPMVSRPVYLGGLGFGMKWDMGWMHDTLSYLSRDPVTRKFHHNNLTFRQMYANDENYVLPLSHDEVKPGMGSLLSKMPGDEWHKFANLRLLLGYMFSQQGKKLLFMGGEFGQWNEWHHDANLDWALVDSGSHGKIRSLTGTLNWMYKSEPALHQLDCDPGGFEWIDGSDADLSVISFLRRSERPAETILIVCNFTPLPRFNYRVGVPHGGFWREILNTDATAYGGAGYGNMGGADATPLPHHGRHHSLNLTLPPLAALFFKAQG